MSSALTPLIGPIPGGPEMLVILLIAVLLFGANKIPKLARSTGQAMGEFQRGREEIEQELDEIKDGGDAGTSTDDTLGSTDDTSTGSELGSETETTEESS